MVKLRVERLDLMQVHNLVDSATHLATLREWKAAGRVRYLGVTHYHAGAHADLEKVIAQDDIDFVQVNYSLVEPEAERRLLRAAADTPDRGDREPTLRRRSAVPPRQGQAAAGLGRGHRLCDLGTVRAQVDPRPTPRSPAPFPEPAIPPMPRTTWAPRPGPSRTRPMRQKMAAHFASL